MKFGNRIPYEYFMTSGVGESDIGFHTGSFDKAMIDAGIGYQNIMFYTSILPPIAKEVKKRKLYPGSVLETIMAVANGKKGERVTAGIGIGDVFKGKKKIVGLVAEYHGNASEAEAKKWLKNALEEMFNARFNKGYKLKTKVKVRSFVPKKEYGTAIVAICFVSYKIK